MLAADTNAKCAAAAASVVTPNYNFTQTLTATGKHALCHGDTQATTYVSGADLIANFGLSGNLCHIDCSNRGICDYQSGECACYPGFAGVDCHTIDAFAGSE